MCVEFCHVFVHLGHLYEYLCMYFCRCIVQCLYRVVSDDLCMIVFSTDLSQFLLQLVQLSMAVSSIHTVAVALVEFIVHPFMTLLYCLLSVVIVF